MVLYSSCSTSLPSSPLVVLGSNPEDDGRLGGGVDMGRGQLAMGDNTGAPRATVDPCKGHGAGLSPGLGLQAKVHGVLGDGARRVSRWLPGEMSTLGTLKRN